MQRRTFLAAVGAAGLGLRGARASVEFPDHAVKLIVPFLPGTSVGINARRLQPFLERTLGQQVNLDYRSGSGGMAGHLDGVQAQADGYTLTLISASLTIQPWVNTRSVARPDDFAFIGQMTVLPSLLLVRSDSPYRTLADLVSACRADPNTVRTGSLMSWWPPALTQALLFQRASIHPSITMAYYFGSDMIEAMLQGALDFAIVGISDVNPSLREGAVRALAVTSHSAALPAAPTFREQGWDIALGWWRGLAVPKATPDAVVGRLSAALRQALDDPALHGDFAQSGLSVDPLDGPLFHQAVEEEYHTLGALMTALHQNKQSGPP